MPEPFIAWLKTKKRDFSQENQKIRKFYHKTRIVLSCPITTLREPCFQSRLPRDAASAPKAELHS